MECPRQTWLRFPQKVTKIDANFQLRFDFQFVGKHVITSLLKRIYCKLARLVGQQLQVAIHWLIFLNTLVNIWCAFYNKLELFWFVLLISPECFPLGSALISLQTEGMLQVCRTQGVLWAHMMKNLSMVSSGHIFPLTLQVIISTGLKNNLVFDLDIFTFFNLPNLMPANSFPQVIFSLLENEDIFFMQ